MISNVKSFWAKFKKGKSRAATHTVEQWSTYFEKLFNEDNQDWSCAEAVESHCQKYDDLFGAPSEHDMNKANCLNDHITDSEVHKAFTAVNLGKAVGADRIPAEFFRQAFHELRFEGEDGKIRTVREYLLTPVLTTLFDKIMVQKQYPSEWSVGVVTPVPKPKGDINVMDNYRAITVGSAISKIFAQVIMNRMNDWAESHEMRAATQFGFRKGMGTTEAIFMLRHLVDKAQMSDKHLFTAFIDFKKAYDSVPRALLWRCLKKLGIHGSLMEILEQMYSSVRLQVKLDNVMGAEFQSNIGVKQGDPLSPLLFGLYIDRFASFLRDRCPKGDVICGNEIVQLLFYADDLAMVTHDPQLLQDYLKTLETFCQATGLNVNVAKTEIVVFSRQWSTGSFKWFFNKKQIQVSKEFVYLGVVFANKGFKTGVKKTIKRRGSKAKSALFSLVGTCHGLKVFDTSVLKTLFNGAVVPSAIYGGEVWCPDLFQYMNADCIYDSLEETQWLFTRMALWVGKGTPHICLLKEMELNPIILRCVANTVRFWNRVCSNKSNPILVKMMQENLHSVTNGWTRQFQNMLRKTMDGADVTLHDNDGLRTINTKQVITGLVSMFEKFENRTCALCENATQRLNGSLVRACPNDVRNGFKIFKYKRWFQKKEEESPSVISYLQDVNDIRVMARFRCGMHWLATEKQRSKDVGRSDRVCVCCSRNEREDELHLLFCDAYEQIRQLFPNVFTSMSYGRLHDAYLNNSHEVDDHMNAFMNQDDQDFVISLVAYLRKSIKARDDLLNGRT